MKIKNVKIISITFLIAGLFLIFFRIIPDVSNSAFGYYEFFRGMLAGISSVAAVVWLIFIMFAVNNPGDKRGIISRIFKSKQILSSIGLSCLFIAAIIVTWFWDNYFLTVSGIISAGVSIVLNTSFLRKANGKIC